MSIGIGLGVAGFPFSSQHAFLKWIDLCEDRGVDSVWLSERIVSRQPNLELMTTFGVIAGRTERLKFGMNAIVVPLRDPLILAKQCASLDYLSGGRLLPVFGVGGETNPEFAATGRSPKGRGAQSDEALDLLAALWTGEPVTYEGQHYRYRNAVISPRPIQQPLPLWIGGSSEAAIRRTARIGTGWLAGLQSPAQVAPVVAAIRERSAANGRPLDDDHYGAGFAFRFGSWDEPVVQRQASVFARIPDAPAPADYLAIGSAQDIAARIREYIAAGISKFVLRPLAEDDEGLIVQTRRLCEEVIPQFASLRPAS
ncbi:MAG TPA: LLM class flavin-dependent oxidoreductase [Tepidiformaceae bacterium]|nr:LLM class flavin-dependent oxidoreductase [Tepidiformaceae bacterium]HNO65540.1 LLM class flavin-dependent oxidoreductase [Tepidiformaceae bacterium]